MSLAIAGMGWVTPLGTAIALVWERLIAGEEASATTISEEFACRSYTVFRVPESAHVAHARLRRASAISRFAAAAGLSALDSGGLKIDATNAERVACVLAIVTGCVVY